MSILQLGLLYAIKERIIISLRKYFKCKNICQMNNKKISHFHRTVFSRAVQGTENKWDNLTKETKMCLNHVLSTILCFNWKEQLPREIKNKSAPWSKYKWMYNLDIVFTHFISNGINIKKQIETLCSGLHWCQIQLLIRINDIFKIIVWFHLQQGITQY